MTLFPSACTWTCKEDPKQVLRQVKETAFHHIDVTADFARSAGLMEEVQKLGLKVSNILIDRVPPAAGALNGKDAQSMKLESDRLRQVIGQCAAARPQALCIMPCSGARNLKHFGDAASALAEEAAKHGVRLCVENHPRSALPAAQDVLRFLEGAKHPNLFLVLDTGHALLAGEDPAQAILAAGSRLGGVMFNDNNGKWDRHWALLEGRLTEESLRRALQALMQVGYQGTLGIEVRWDRASVISGLSKNRNLLLRLQAAGEVKSLLEPEARRKG